MADFNIPTKLAEGLSDAIFRHLPKSSLTASQWQSCRIVAHRGCPDYSNAIYENTMLAFERAENSGVWGIEFDVQWTRDRVPVVIHDTATNRLPGDVAVEVGSVDFTELRRFCPLVPRLEEVLERFSGKLHLMIELKSETLDSKAMLVIEALLTDLHPVKDYHLLSLQPDELREINCCPAEAKVLVAITNTRKIFNQFLAGGFGGVTGHYLLLNSRMRRQLGQQGASWGTGFVNSLGLLTRELKSGATWVFSNNAVNLVADVDSSK